jgi:predicted transcriptional regulator YdeE
MDIRQIEGFTTVGREARTSNGKEMKGEGVIGAMWSSDVPTASPIVAVYSEYESDKDGEYNYLLGCKFAEDETVPREKAHRQVLGGRYLRLESTGPVSPAAVVGLWQQVWDMETQGQILRTYKTDFELYGANGFELFVGVKD